MSEYRAAPAGVRNLSETELLAEIAWFEARLKEIGDDADCAYDKALARAYSQTVVSHRERLSALRGTRA